MPILRPSDALERLLFCERLGDIFLDQILSGYFTSNNFPQIFDFISRDRSTFACGCMKSLSNGSFSAAKNAVSPTDAVGRPFFERGGRRRRGRFPERFGLRETVGLFA